MLWSVPILSVGTSFSHLFSTLYPYSLLLAFLRPILSSFPAFHFLLSKFLHSLVRSMFPYQHEITSITDSFLHFRFVFPCSFFSSHLLSFTLFLPPILHFLILSFLHHSFLPSLSNSSCSSNISLYLFELNMESARWVSYSSSPIISLYSLQTESEYCHWLIR